MIFEQFILVRCSYRMPIIDLYLSANWHNIYLPYIHVGAELKIFGSSANGFGSKNSDLDICMILPGYDKVSTISILCTVLNLKFAWNKWCYDKTPVKWRRERGWEGGWEGGWQCKLCDKCERVIARVLWDCSKNGMSQLNLIEKPELPTVRIFPENCSTVCFTEIDESCTDI